MEEKTTKPAKKGEAKNKTGLIVGIVVAVLVVVAVIVAIIAFTSKKDDGGSNDGQGDSSSKVEEVGTKEVGDAEYGYVTIPANWKKVEGVDEGLQFSDPKSEYFVSMLVEDASEIDAETWAAGMEVVFERSGIDDVKTETKTIPGVGDAVVVTGYYDSPYNRWLAAWIVDTPDDKVHYIAVEGPDKNNDIFSAVETFKYTK